MKPTPLPDQQHPAAAGADITRWVQLARQGDRTAFHQLVDRFQTGIYRMIYYRTGSRMDAEDLTQDVFLKAFRNIKRLQSAALFRSWIYRIAVNRVRDFYRRKQFLALFQFSSVDDERFQETPEMAVPAQASREMARKDFWKRVARAMAHLSRMEKEVFMLRFFDQLSIQEITDTLGKNQSTVKTHLYRALGKLKNELNDLQDLVEDV